MLIHNCGSKKKVCVVKAKYRENKKPVFRGSLCRQVVEKKVIPYIGKP